MFAKIFSYPILIKEHHLDTFGHVNNATYLSLFEEARWNIITQNGYGLQKILSSGLGPTILEIKIRFLKELRLRQTIIIETKMLGYEDKLGKLAQTIIRDNDICCSAEFVFGLFNLNERKLIAPTEEWLHAIGLTDQ